MHSTVTNGVRGAAVAIVVAILLGLWIATPAAAADCQAVTAPIEITEPGCYELTNDLTDSDANAAVRILASDVVFDGGGHTLDGTHPDELDANYGVQLGNGTIGVSNVTVRDVTVTDWQTGVTLTNAEASVVDGVTSERAGSYGISVGDSSWRNTIENSRVSGWKGIRIYSSSSNTIRNNEIYDTREWGLQLTRSSDYTTVTGNTVTGASTGILITSHSNVVSGNTVSNNRNSGIYTSGRSGNTEFSDGQITGNAGTGLVVAGSGHTVANLTVANNDGPDVAADGATLTAKDLDVGTATFAEATLADVIVRTAQKQPAAPKNAEHLGVAFNASNTAPSGYLDVRVAYDPADAVGVDEATVGLWHHDETAWSEVPGSTVDAAADAVAANATSFSEFALFGTAAASKGPDVTLDPRALDFDSVDVGDSGQAVVTVANRGDGTLTVTDVGVSGADADQFAIQGDGFTLGPGDDREVDVAFVPDAVGDASAELVVKSDDPDEPTATVALSGTGVDPDALTGCTVISTPGRYVLGDDVTDATADACFEITTSDVVLDGNGHLVDGTNVGHSSAVSVNGTDGRLTNVTVSDLNVTQFDRGLTVTDAEVAASDLTGAPNVVAWTYGANLTLAHSTFQSAMGVNAEPLADQPSHVVVEAVAIDSFRGGYADESTLVVRNSTIRQYPDDDAIVLREATLELSNSTIEPLGERMRFGVLARDNSSVSVADTTVRNVSEAITLVDSTGTVVDSVVTNAGKNGLNATRSTLVASGNVVEDSNQAGNVRDGGAIFADRSTATVSDNELVGGRESGVELLDSTGVVENNTVGGFVGEINVVDSDATVANNTVDGQIVVFGRSFSTDGQPTATATVRHNDVWNVGWGVRIDADAKATVEHNEINATFGVSVDRGAGATIRHNVFRDPLPQVPQSSRGISVGDDRQNPHNPARSVSAHFNEFHTDVGIVIEEEAPASELTAHLNDLSGSDVALQNDDGDDATTTYTLMNYYGPRGPTDDLVVGEWTDVEPFLTAASGIDDYEATETTQAFGLDLEFEAGRSYALGTPAPLAENLSTVFDDFEGAVYVYDATEQRWTLATGDEVLGAMEAVVVLPTTDARAVIDFADDVPARATQRQLDTQGWHFVAPRMQANAEDAFSTRTVGATDLLAAFDEPADDSLLEPGERFVRYSFATDPAPVHGSGPVAYPAEQYGEAPTVNPFTGYFVYVHEPGTVPGAVPAGVDFEQFLHTVGGAS